MRPLVAGQGCGGRRAVIRPICYDVKIDVVRSASAHRSKAIRGGLGINDPAEDRARRIHPSFHCEAIGGEIAEKAGHRGNDLIVGPVKVQRIA